MGRVAMAWLRDLNGGLMFGGLFRRTRHAERVESLPTVGKRSSRSTCDHAEKLGELLNVACIGRIFFTLVEHLPRPRSPFVL